MDIPPIPSIDAPVHQPSCALPARGPAPQGAASVQALEQRSLNAWSAPRSAVQGDWLLRSAGGYTKRANSANALCPGAQLDMPLLQSIEAWYAHQGLPSIFRLSPLASPEVDALLHAQGYTVLEPSLVLQRATQSSDHHWRPPGACQLRIRSTPDADWLDSYSRASDLPAASDQARRSILHSCALPRAFATLEREQQTLAWGMAVLERGAVGIYEVLVHPAERRHGWGRQLMQGLLHWAAQSPASHTDLQMLQSNAPALQLYQQLGFAPAYGYHYRIPPARPALAAHPT